jgi:aminoglycoside 2''-phosphotransferase
MPAAGIEKRPVNVERYARVIEAAYPDLQGAEVRLVNEEGQYNDTLVINDAFIFRFPRYQAGVEMMRREVSFLQGIRGQTSLPVPDPIYTNLETEKPGEIFMGYPLLPGEPLWRPAIFAETDERVLDMWAQQLAGFLKELHSLPTAEFGGDWPAADAQGEWEEMYAEIRTDLFPLMRVDARGEVAGHFESYLDDLTLQNFQPAPRHGDYGSGNILYDSSTMMITGIIDFGFAAIGDPAMDIAAASTLGDALFGRFPNTYPAVESMMPRVRFYRGTYALIEALHGFKSGDRQAFEAGMARYV